MSKLIGGKLGLLWVFIFVFCCFMLVAEGSIESDAQASVNIAYNLVRGRGFTISPPDQNQGIQVVLGRGGQYYSGTGIVGNLIYVPTAYLAKVIHQFRGDEEKPLFPLEADYLNNFLASFVNPIFGFLLFIVMYKIFRWYLSTRRSVILALIMSMTTNLLPLSKQALYHIPYIFFLMVSVYFIVKYLRAGRRINLVLSGFLMGVSILTYNVTGFLMAGLVGLFLLSQLTSDKKTIVYGVKNIILWGGSILPSVLVFLYFNYYRFGNPLNTGYDPNSYDLLTKGNLYDGLWGFLFSPGKSIFLYSPILVLVFWVALNRYKEETYSKLFLVLAIVWLLFYSRLVFWHGDLCWGPRYMAVLIPFGGMVLATNWDYWKKWVAGILVLIGLFIQLEGTTIAYQIQYGPYDMKILNQQIGPDRGSVFEYWGIGTFIPRFSPVNHFKREVVNRWLSIYQYFTDKNLADFVGGVSAGLPRNGRYFRHGLSTWVMYSQQNFSLEQVDFELLQVNQPVKSLRVCVEGKCTTTKKVEKKNELFEVRFETPIKIEKDKYLVMTLNEPSGKILKNDFEYDLYQMKINSESINLRTLKRANTDSTFMGNYPVKPNYASLPVLWQIRGEVQELVNLTPDFWWIKTQIYFNLPDYFRWPFWALVVVLGISGVGTVGWFWINRGSDQTGGLMERETYDYYHKNTFWNDHYLVRKYMNRLATDDENVDWLHFVYNKYFKKRKQIRVLSVGCGNGWQDRWLDEIFDVAKLDGYDISETLLAEAREKSDPKRFSYFKADLNQEDIGTGEKYDLIVNLAALHHVENMEHLLAQIKTNLKPDGLFVNFDFVGPMRNQYDDDDLEAMNRMQQKLPSELVGRSKIVRPDLGVMLREDPSEAVGSELIIPGIKKLFKVVRLRYLNGGLLYQVLYNQIQNFRQGDMDHDKILLKALAEEEKQTAKGKVKPLFAFVVAKLKN